MKLLSKLFALCLLVAVVYIFYDNYLAKKGRDGKGIGIEIHPDTGLFCNSQGVQVKDRREGTCDKPTPAGNFFDTLFPFLILDMADMCYIILKRIILRLFLSDYFRFYPFGGIRHKGAFFYSNPLTCPQNLTIFTHFC